MADTYFIEMLRNSMKKKKNDQDAHIVLCEFDTTGVFRTQSNTKMELFAKIVNG